MKRSAFHGWLAFLLAATLAGAEETNLKSDEQIVFYPSFAQRVKGETNLWHAEIRGNVFEIEKRGLLVAAFRETLELKTEELSPAQEVVFAERARLFLVDHERNKSIYIRLGTNEFFVGKSSADGNFSAEITFAGPPPLAFTARLKTDDVREFHGRIFPMAEEGISIISDLDDTIKVTEVRDRKKMLHNTFASEFRAVPGMATQYQKMATEHNVSFHYVSASPWQLFEPLNRFVVSNGFPAGTFELKPFRWKDRSFFSLFSSPEKYKPGVIEPLLQQFPKRVFVLIGDSGERDPEIYGALARKYPEQIFRILIRDVTNESAAVARYQEAFRAVPPERWQVYRDPSEIKCLCE